MKKQKGFTLLEMSIALLISSSLIGSFFYLNKQEENSLKSNIEQHKISNLKESIETYIKFNHDTLITNTEELSLPISTLKNDGFLNASFNEKDSFGNELKIRILNQDIGTTGKKKISYLIFTESKDKEYNLNNSFKNINSCVISNESCKGSNISINKNLFPSLNGINNGYGFYSELIDYNYFNDTYKKDELSTKLSSSGANSSNVPYVSNINDIDKTTLKNGQLVKTDKFMYIYNQNTGTLHSLFQLKNRIEFNQLVNSILYINPVHMNNNMFLDNTTNTIYLAFKNPTLSNLYILKYNLNTGEKQEKNITLTSTNLQNTGSNSLSYNIYFKDGFLYIPMTNGVIRTDFNTHDFFSNGTNITNIYVDDQKILMNTNIVCDLGFVNCFTTNVNFTIGSSFSSGIDKISSNIYLSTNQNGYNILDLQNNKFYTTYNYHFPFLKNSSSLKAMDSNNNIYSFYQRYYYKSNISFDGVNYKLNKTTTLLNNHVANFNYGKLSYIEKEGKLYFTSNNFKTIFDSNFNFIKKYTLNSSYPLISDEKSFYLPASLITPQYILLQQPESFIINNEAYNLPLSLFYTEKTTISQVAPTTSVTNFSSSNFTKTNTTFNNLSSTYLSNPKNTNDLFLDIK